MKIFFTVLALAFLSSGITTAQSQSEIPIETKWFKPLGVEEGLSQGDAFEILQDDLGFIWISTAEGLNRFDGSDVKSFYFDPEESFSLPSGRIYDMSLGDNGRLWVGSSRLSLFDTHSGQFVRNYDVPHAVGYVSESRSGPIWAASLGSSRLSKIDSRTGDVFTFESIAGDPRSLPEGRFAAAQHGRWAHHDSYFFEDDFGNVWFSKGDTLVAYEGEEAGFVRYSAGNRPSVIDADSTGTLWVGSADGLSRLNPTTGETERIWDQDQSLSNVQKIIRSIHVDHEQRIWFTTKDNVYAVDAKSGQMVHSFRTPQPSEGEYPLFISHISEEEIWFVRYNYDGVYRYRYADDSFTQIIRDPRDSSGRVTEFIRDVFIDRGRTLWMAANRGSGLKYGDLEFKAFSSIGVGESELVDPVVWRVTEDRDGGILAMTYAGLEYVDPVRNTSMNFPEWEWSNQADLLADDQGDFWVLAANTTEIGRWLSSNSEMVTYRSGKANSPGLGAGQPLRFAEDPSGTIWIGTQNDGVYFFDRSTQSFGALPGDSPEPLSSTRVLTFVVDRNGDLWWSHQTGLYKRSRMTGDISKFHHYDTGEEMGRVIALVEDHVGTMWFTAEGQGLGRVNVERNVTELFFAAESGNTSLNGTIRTVDTNDNLWMVTRQSGVIKFNPRTGAVDRFTVQNSDLPMNSIMSILPGTQNDVWISTNGQGLARIDIDTNEIRVFTAAEGLPSQEFNGRAGSVGHSGRLIFGGPRGITYFDPNDFADNDRSPNIVLNTVRLFDQPIQAGPDAPLARPASVANTLHLAHNQNDLTFEYIGLHYSDASSVRYEHILDGYEDEWRNVGDVQTATYPNLPFGSYTFRARAVTASGIISDRPIALSVVITPPWWRTWWAYIGYGILVVFGGLLVHRVQSERTRRLERERTKDRELAQAEKLKVAHTELQDTHEKLKASQEQLIHAEKMASLGQLTAGIAHEIKNPLNFVTNFAEVNAELSAELAEAVDSGNSDEIKSLLADITENTTQIARHGTRADAIVRSMMQHASGAGPTKESIDINSFVGQQADLAWHGRRARDHGFKAEIVRALDENAGSAEVFPQELGRVLINLINNACDAVSGAEKPQITISTKRSNGQVSITVADNGPGIPDDIREKIFEPFFTTKPTGEGNTGLGLSISYDIVTEGHGGMLTVDSEPGKGATFKISIPE